MTERIYYTEPALLEFTARVVACEPNDGAHRVVLDRTAFYPTSGGQPHDVGVLETAGAKVGVRDVVDEEATGRVQHITDASLPAGAEVRGVIDSERRRDHMQQHTGQHVLSAAFERLFQFATASFHLGAESCTIDLAAKQVTPEQLKAAERLANEVVGENRPVTIRFATADEARAAGVRKVPPAQRDKLRLIDIRDFDLNACGGTHVAATGEVGAILVRKTEAVKQGTRVEFVCGLRAVRAARRDFEAVTEAGSVFSCHIWEVPQHAAKAIEALKSAGKSEHKLLEEIAALNAERLLAEADSPGAYKLVVQSFAERGAGFVKLLAQKITAAEPAVALLLAGQERPTFVLAQTPKLASGHNMGALLQQALQKLGGRGGGSADMAQGGLQTSFADAEAALHELAEKVKGS